MKLIKSVKDIKRISLLDGKFYLGKDIKEIIELTDEIRILTKHEYVLIPKTSISRIEYFAGVVVDGNKNKRSM